MLASVLIKPKLVTKTRKVPDKMDEHQQGKGTESEKRFWKSYFLRTFSPF
jgi:hypothetical protein